MTKKRDGVTIRDSIGRIQKAVFINESGLYALILSSRHGRKSTGAYLRWLNIARFKNERRRKRKKKVSKKKVIKKRLSKKAIPVWFLCFEKNGTDTQIKCKMSPPNTPLRRIAESAQIRKNEERKRNEKEAKRKEIIKKLEREPGGGLFWRFEA